MRMILCSLLVALSVGCTKTEATPDRPGDQLKGEVKTDAKGDKPTTPAAAPAIASPNGASAEIGKPAPEFELTSLDGAKVKLSDYKGKLVVLEWFNPGCPFVKKAHLEGELKGLGDKMVGEGVVWLAINSGAPGKQGASIEENTEGKKKFGFNYPILLDPEGAVGKAYGATNTPHMYVIDKDGKLVYAGALDSTKGGDVEDTPDLVNYLKLAVEETKAGKPVTTAKTEAWGCTVKYK
jgi:peroxiredoxin